METDGLWDPHLRLLMLVQTTLVGSSSGWSLDILYGL